MSVSIHDYKVRVDSKRDALRYLILLKCHERGIQISLADIDVLIELDELGYGKEFYDSCMEKKYFGSYQTIVNSITRMTNLGILTKPKKGFRNINREIFPSLREDKVLIKYMIGNL